VCTACGFGDAAATLYEPDLDPPPPPSAAALAAAAEYEAEAAEHGAAIDAAGGLMPPMDAASAELAVERPADEPGTPPQPFAQLELLPDDGPAEQPGEGTPRAPAMVADDFATSDGQTAASAHLLEQVEQSM
jgi:hypothetical protein